MEGAKVVARTLALRTLLTVSTAIACGGIGWFIESPSEVRKLLLVFSFALVGRSVSHWTNSIFTAYESSKYNFQQEAIFRLVEVAAGLIVVFAGGSVVALALA